MKPLRNAAPADTSTHTTESHTGDSPTDDPSEPVWRALANPWRRRILDVLRESPRTTGELTDVLDTTRHQLLVHLEILRKADLVLTVAEGRVRRNYLNAVPLRMIHDRWLSRYESLWSDVLLDLRADLEAEVKAATRPVPTAEETSLAG